MRQPVIAADGHTYEKSNIEGWIQYYQDQKWPVTSPVTEEVLKNTTLVPNHMAKALIDEAFEVVGGRVRGPLRRPRLGERRGALQAPHHPNGYVALGFSASPLGRMEGSEAVFGSASDGVSGNTAAAQNKVKLLLI